MSTRKDNSPPTGPNVAGARVFVISSCISEMQQVFCVTATNMAINRALKIAILDHGTTQIALARAVGISEPRMSRIMRGHDEPTEDEKKAIAKILRRKVHELFSEVAA